MKEDSALRMLNSVLDTLEPWVIREGKGSFRLEEEWRASWRKWNVSWDTNT